MQSTEEILNLKWSSFPSQLTLSMDTCYQKQRFVDVSLVCKDGTILKCHKMVLANGSMLFCRLLTANDHPHPMIILHDIDADDLKKIINFMYSGEIKVAQSEVKRLLRIANVLEVIGLTQIQTLETGGSDSENLRIDQRNVNKNSQESDSVSASKSVISHGIDSSGARFDSSRSSTNSSRSDAISPQFNSNSLRTEYTGKFTKNPVKSQRKENFGIHYNRIEGPNQINRDPLEQRKDLSHGIEAIESSKSRLAKAGIDIQEVSRPGTSKSPQFQQCTQKRKHLGSSNPINWTRVLNMLSHNNQLPIKKFCMMDEVEISASGASSSQMQQSSQFPVIASTSTEPVEIIICDEDESLFDSNGEPDI